MALSCAVAACQRPAAPAGGSPPTETLTTAVSVPSPPPAPSALAPATAEPSAPWLTQGCAGSVPEAGSSEQLAAELERRCLMGLRRTHVDEPAKDLTVGAGCWRWGLVFPSAEHAATLLLHGEALGELSRTVIRGRLGLLPPEGPLCLEEPRRLKISIEGRAEHPRIARYGPEVAER